MRFLLGVQASHAGRQFASAPKDDYLTARTGARIGDMRVFRACLQGSCDYRLYSPDSPRDSGIAQAARR